jgi:hypothetical protein
MHAQGTGSRLKVVAEAAYPAFKEYLSSLTKIIQLYYKVRQKLLQW